MAQLQATGVTGSLVTTGNVGIGLTNPQSPLHVIAANQNNNALIQEWSYTNASIDQYSLMLKQTVTSGVVRYNFSMVNNNTAYDNVLVLDRGNVGIGITTPTSKFYVVGDSVITGRLRGGTFSDSYIEFPSSGNAILKANDDVIIGYSSNFYVKQGGNVGIGTITPASLLHVYGSGNTFARYTNTTSAGHYIDIGANSAGESFVYGYGAYPLLFGTNGNTRMVINSSGLVGIGTNTPAYLFHVQGSNLMATFRNSSTSTNQYTQLEFIAGSREAYIWLGNQATTSWAGDGGLNIYTGTGNMDFWTAATQRMRLTSGGNLGIGTLSPTYPLHVYAGTNLLRLTSTGTDARINIGHSGNGGFVGYTNLGATGNVFYVTTGAGTIGSGFVMDNNGNVGIGLTNPAAKLVVAGQGSGTGLIGNAGFSSNYTGISLNGTLSGTSYNILSSPTETTLYINRPSGASIRFRESNSDQMVITTGGNVGIGTGDPSQKLDIRDGNLEFSDSAFSRIPEIRFTGNSGGRYVYAGIKADEDGSYNGHLEFWTTPTSLNHTAANAAFAERMRITAAGNVGIGLTNPGATFVVGTQSSGQAGSGYESDNSILSRVGASNEGRRMIGLTIANTAAATVGNDASLSFIVASNYSATGIISTILQNTSTAYSDMTFSVYNGSGNPERMRINGVAGNVGIGNTNPSRKLDVLEGNVQIVANFQNTSTTSSRIKFTDANTGAENVNIGATGTSLAMWTNNTVRMTILSGGNVGIGTTVPIRDLMIGDLTSTSTATPKTFSLGGTYSSTAGSNVKLRVYEDGSSIGGMSVSSGQMEVNTWSSGKIAFYRGTTLSMVINTSSNLGIGTASPAAKLHVNGTLRVDSSTSFGTEYGAVPNAIIGNKQDEKCLGNPDEWLAINVSGTDYAVPLFSLG